MTELSSEIRYALYVACGFARNRKVETVVETFLAAARAEGARDVARRLDDLVEGRVVHQGGWYGERSHEQLKASLRGMVRALLADGGEPAVTERPYCLRCEVPIYDDEGTWRREGTGSQVCPRNPAVDGHEPRPTADGGEPQ